MQKCKLTTTKGIKNPLWHFVNGSIVCELMEGKVLLSFNRWVIVMDFEIRVTFWEFRIEFLVDFLKLKMVAMLDF